MDAHRASRPGARALRDGGDKIDSAALIGTIATIGGESAFIKLIGPAGEVAAATAAYTAFCRSLR